MGCDVFANMREIACKAASGKSICAFPDVCFTPPQAPPTPPGVPIPYPNTAQASDTTKGTKKVKISNKEVLLKNKSCLKTSVGNEAGNTPKKGMMTSKTKGKGYFTSWSMDVKFEGKNVVRHFDLVTHNHGSMVGNTPPWVYMDSMDMGLSNTGGEKSCDEQKKDADKCKKSKSAGKGKGLDCSEKCKKAMACELVSKENDKKQCCNPTTTGHHLVEVNCFTYPGGRTPNTLTKNSPMRSFASIDYADGKVRRESLPGFSGYNDEKAPTVCAETVVSKNDHGSMHAAQDHMKKAFKAKRGREPLGSFGSGSDEQSYWTLKEACAVGARAHKVEHPHCNEECTRKALEDYHEKEAGIPLDTPVRSDFSSNRPKGQERLSEQGKWGSVKNAWKQIVNS